MRIRCRPCRQLRGEPPIHELTSWRHGQMVAKQLRKPVDIVKAENAGSDGTLEHQLAAGNVGESKK